MLQKLTRVTMADASGAHMGRQIQIYRGHGRSHYAYIGTFIRIVVKKVHRYTRALRLYKTKKRAIGLGALRRGYVVHTKSLTRYNDYSFWSFSGNRMILMKRR